jgi:hypothetical protein
VPLATLLTLFLAFFSFELRIKGRAAGWLGLFCLGAILFSAGIGLRRAPIVRELAVPLAAPASMRPALRLIPRGAAVQQGRVALWVGSFVGSEAEDAVAVDFGSDYPRLSYAPRAPIDTSTGDLEILGRTYNVALPPGRSVNLVPEASLFSGTWFWDRLAAMDGSPLPLVFSVAAGFLLLAIGFRFLCRMTGWPLANVFLAAAGLTGLVVLDAVLAGPSVSGSIASLARRAGLALPSPLIVACMEGGIGLMLGAIDIAAGGKGGRRRGA